MSQLIIRNATLEDLPRLTKVEEAGFPKEEAASEKSLAERICTYPQGFLVGEEGEKIIGHINGASSDKSAIEDAFFESMVHHKQEGKYLMVYGLAVLPAYQGRGYARQLMNAYIAFAKAENKVGLLLTCKENLIPFYQNFGYVNEGLSESGHGGAVWYDMKLNL